MLKIFSHSEKITPPRPVEKPKARMDQGLEDYGSPEIDNPEILRLISAIDLPNYPPEKVDGLMAKIIRDNASPEQKYTLAGVLAERAKAKELGLNPAPQVLYGYGGFNRYRVDTNGRVVLMTGENIQPLDLSIEKARELGMEID